MTAARRRARIGPGPWAVWAATGLALAAACSVAQDAPPERTTAADMEAGRSAWTRCACCHFVPDPALETDRIWTEMIRTTA